MNKTDWFSGTEKPGRIGVYERDYSHASFAGDRSISVTFSYWDGKQWGLYGNTPAKALEKGNFRSSHQRLPWRGLAESPKRNRAAAKKTGGQ